tara:strand:- start:215 stop:457 length:243 start_codon:yes stop_codon:yes gene_type:complete
MLDYIKENCQLPPLNRPEYDSDTETYDLYFAEKEVYNAYGLEQELICLPFETLEEANETLKQALEISYEKNTEENQETTR